MLPKRCAWFGAQAHLVETESPSGPIPLPDFPYRPLESETEKWVGNAFCERLEGGLALPQSGQKTSDLPLLRAFSLFEVWERHLFFTRPPRQCQSLTVSPAPTDWETVDNKCILSKGNNEWMIYFPQDGNPLREG